MKAVTKQEWADALRSGKFRQTTGSLRDGTGFCCLGVLCEITGIPRDEEKNWAYVMNDSVTHVPASINSLVPYELQRKYVKWNDRDKLTFQEIADKVEADDSLKF